MKKLLCLLALACTSLSVTSQISGKVVEKTDNKLTALPGVIVRIKNTGEFSMTDTTGSFSFPTAKEKDTLVFTLTGYKTEARILKDLSKPLTVVLGSGINLNEVEVEYRTTGTELSTINPMKVEILNERSLMKAACCNLSESFETNPSIDVNFADAVSGTKQIQMLGLSGQYALITKENMPYLRGLANSYGLTFIPGTWIQSIQLGKGAGSVINGYESFTGQINTELQNPESSDKFQYNAYLNQNMRQENNLNLRHSFNENFSAGVLLHQSGNYIEEDLNKDGFADIPTGRQWNIMNKYSVMTKKGFEAQFGGGYVKDERTGGQFAKFMAGNDSASLYKIGINNEKWEVYSKTGFIFKKPGTSMGLQLSYLDHKQFNSFGNNQYTGGQKTFYANYIFQGLLRTTDHIYKIGASFMNDDVNETYRLFKYKRTEQVGGIFMEYAYSYKTKFNLVAGVREDYHNYYGAFFTPRLHMRYAFNEGKSIFRISGGRALRTANIFSDNASLMASSRDWIVTATDFTMPYGLKPERAWNYGMNFTQKFKINYREAYVTIDVYRTEFSDQVVVDLDENVHEVHVYNLKGESYSNTAQFEFNFEPRKRLFVKTAYRYVDTKVKYTQSLLEKPFVSQHRAFINFSYETKDNHWQFDLTGQYNGAKRLPSTQANPEVYKRANRSPDFYNVLGQITYLTKIKKAQLHVYLGVENLLDYKQRDPIVASDLPYSKYFDATMVWGPIYGRMVYFGLRVKIK
jgi:outer membrane receptor for ferrienterochelin and colicin